MALLDNWKAVLTGAHSVKLTAASGLLSTLEFFNAFTDVLPVLQGVIPPGVFAGLAFACAVASVYSRLVKQPELHTEATNGKS